MKYLKNLTNHNAYSSFIVGSDFNSIQTEHNASVSYCKNERHIHYNPYIPPKANLLDILYSDSNGNKIVDSNVLDPSLGYVPIGLCIARTDFFGTGEKARFMSLKLMDYSTPETGSELNTTTHSCQWNYDNIGFGDIYTIDNIQKVYKDGKNFGLFNVDYYNNTNNIIPNLIVNNEWNLSELGEINEYATTDIDGKNKTNKILSILPQTIFTKDYTYETYRPIHIFIYKYHTLGTNQGDWYLGAAGELSMIAQLRTQINNKLQNIQQIYPNNCELIIEDWIDLITSTEYSETEVYSISMTQGYLRNDGKQYGKYGIALLQY